MVQNFETHLTLNYLMAFYQNEEVVEKQLKVLKGHLSEVQHVARDRFLRFTIASSEQ